MGQLAELARGIDRLGPDGGSEHLNQNLGFAYRACHTTPESASEVQPLIRPGCILTWDGRLDNRDELGSRLRPGATSAPTDAELVLGAYMEWGEGCFAELEGDWALALWDCSNQRLILARDPFGVRRLFYRIDEGGLAWCTTIEPLVTTSPEGLHPDLDYLAGCLYPRPPLESTAYLKIRAVIPATFLVCQSGGLLAKRYWSLNPHARIRYADDQEYEEHFRSLFRQAVSRRLRADRTVLAELSGGVDSSSIVCVADEIRRGRPGPSVETLSYYDSDEPSGDERHFFDLVEKQRGRVGHHISVSEFTARTKREALVPLPEELFVAAPGYFKPTFEWAKTIQDIQCSCNARVILSGLGGDELLGGIQYEAPELAALLSRGHLVSFARATLQWSVARKKTAFQLVRDAIGLLMSKWFPKSLLGFNRPRLSWCHRNPRIRDGAIRGFTAWRELGPSQLNMESVRYALAQQLTSTAPSISGCSELRYPYLDRTLFSFLASIPRAQIVRAGERRRLVRRALRGIVPDEVLFRKTKWFGARHAAAFLRDIQPELDAMFEDRWYSDGIVVNAASVRRELQAIQHGASSAELALYWAICIEQWFRSEVKSERIFFDGALPVRTI